MLTAIIRGRSPTAADPRRPDPGEDGATLRCKGNTRIDAANDADSIQNEAGPGGQTGNDSDSSAAGSHPQHQLFGQATPGPKRQPRTHTRRNTIDRRHRR
jgi:hypothetical protein